MGKLLPIPFILALIVINKHPYWQRIIKNYLMAGDLKYA